MARIRPFRGLRYNPEIANAPLAELCAPLFDVISPEEQQLLYQHSYNAVHLSSPFDQLQAKAELADWRKKGILTLDPLPAFYLYTQEFRLSPASEPLKRIGIIGQVYHLPEKEPGIIRHEHTLPDAVNDRTALLATTLLQTAPTHGLFSDPDFELEKQLQQWIQTPIESFTDNQQVTHSLAIIQTPGAIEAIMDFFLQKPIYLADGHHRLEASEKCFAEAKTPVISTFPETHWPGGWHLMYLSNIHGNDLKILPTHRQVVLPDNFDRKLFLQNISAHFTITPIEILKSTALSQGNFILSFADQHYELRLATARAELIAKMALPLPDVVKSLDYTILHYWIIDNGIGYPYNSQSAESRITYQKDTHKAWQWSKTANNRLTILMPEVQIQDFIAVGTANSKMPQKSTYFWPKVICGLVFNSLAPEDNDSPFDAGFRFTAQAAVAH
jgi:uncharacterized protein (DUF1015 family)